MPEPRVLQLLPVRVAERPQGPTGSIADRGSVGGQWCQGLVSRQSPESPVTCKSGEARSLALFRTGGGRWCLAHAALLAAGWGSAPSRTLMCNVRQLDQTP
jgi:hypothetical protein